MTVIRNPDLYDRRQWLLLWLYPLIVLVAWLLVPLRLYFFEAIPMPVHILAGGVQNTVVAAVPFAFVLLAVLGRKGGYRRQLQRLEAGRPFILFLRGFRNDLDKSVGGRSALEASLVQSHHETAPLVAIDNPKAPSHSAGAVRLKANDDAWRIAVAALSERALAVIIDCRDTTPGLAEEIRGHIEGNHAQNVLFLVHNERGRLPKQQFSFESLGYPVQESTFTEKKKASWPPAFYVLSGGILTVHRAPAKAKPSEYRESVARFLRGAAASPKVMGEALHPSAARSAG